MKIQSSIAGLLKDELRNILPENFYKEIEQEIDRLTFKSIDNSEKTFQIKLFCKEFEKQSVDNKELYIEIDTTNNARIMRMSAQNQRYKTTALLIIAILLGYDIVNKDDFIISGLSLEDKREILSNDRLLRRIDNLKNVIFTKNIEDGDMYKDKLIRLEIESEGKVVISIIIDQNKISISTYDNKEKHEIEINGESSYYSYLEYVSSLKLFTPHLISKGRDFVKYILVEETKNYWYSLDTFIRSLKNKHIKWYAETPKLPKEKIKEQIDAINFLLKAHNKYPYYFKWRKEYLRYCYLKSATKEMEEIDLEQIKQLERELAQHKEKKYQLNENIREYLSTIHSHLKLVILGSPSEQIRKLEDIFNGRETAEELKADIDSTIAPNLSIRPFEIHYKENSSKQVLYIADFEKLTYTFDKLKVLQKGYYLAKNHFEKDKKLCLERIKRVANIEKEMTMVEEKLKKLYQENENLKNYIKHEQEINLITTKLNTELTLLNEMQKGHISIIEDKISITGLGSEIINENILTKQVEKYKTMLNKDVFDNQSLSTFLNDLRNAYELFGKEISDMSKNKLGSSKGVYRDENKLLNKLIAVFEEDILRRCSYYFKATSKGVESYKVKKYDFAGRVFYSEQGDILDLQNGLSGGTDSAMTVYSLGSSASESKFGNILLVDEWGDISKSFHEKVTEKLKELQTLAFAIFVDVDDRYDRITVHTEGR